MTVAIGTTCFADELYWVVGNSATNKCEIVTRNPIVIGDIWFEDGPYNPSLTPSSPARPSASVRKKILQPVDRLAGSVQRAAAALQRSASGHRGVELPKFRLELLVDQQQGFQRAMDVAVATGHDLVNGGFMWSGNHRNSPIFFPAGSISVSEPSFLWITW